MSMLNHPIKKKKKMLQTLQEEVLEKVDRREFVGFYMFSSPKVEINEQVTGFASCKKISQMKNTNP